MTYVTITDTVMFVNQDPKHYGILKPTVIDMEARQGDMAQVFELVL